MTEGGEIQGWDGRYAQEEADICILVTDSVPCTTGTITTLPSHSDAWKISQCLMLEQFEQPQNDVVSDYNSL